MRVISLLLASLFPVTFSHAGPIERACIESVCGKIDTTRTRRELSPLGQRIWNETLAPLARLSLEIEMENAKKMYSLAPMVLKKGVPVSEEKEKFYRAYLQISGLLSRARGEVSEWTDDEMSNGEMRINEKNLAETIQDLSAESRHLYRRLVSQFLKSDLDGTRELDRSFDSLKARLKKRYPSLREPVAIVRDASGIAEKIQAIQKEFGSFLVDHLISDTQRQILRRATRGQIPKEPERKFYLSILDSVQIIELARELQNSVGLPSLDSFVQQAVSRGSFNRLEERSQADDFSSIIHPLTTCANNFVRVLDSTPKDQRILRTLVTSVKTATKAVVGQYVEEPSGLSRLRARLEKVEFVPAALGRDRVSILRLNLTDTANRATALAAALNSADAGLATLLWLVQEDFRYSAERSVITSSIRRTCDDLGERLPTDLALPGRRKILVSPVSQTDPSLALPVLAHEFGHIVSNELRILKSKSFLRSLNCVAQRNPFVEELRVLKSGENTPWSEEDWADHFSASVLEELRKSGFVAEASSPNIACSLMENEAGESERLTPAVGDRHSSPFLRLLLFAFDRNQMTEACRPLLSRANPKARTLRCGD